jgi:hypothetical protein
VVGISTGVNRLGSFDWDLPAQLSVYDLFRGLVTLPRPIVEIDALILPRCELRLEPFVDRSGELLGGLDAGDALDELHIPHTVKVQLVGRRDLVGLERLLTEERDGNTVAAAVIVRAGVERLVNVAYEMDDEPQRIRPRSRIARRVLEDLDLLGKSDGDAAFYWIAGEASFG